MEDEEDLVRKLEEPDRRLQALIDSLESGSLDALEAAARQVTGLATTLLGLFFGVLAFKDDPAYLHRAGVQIFAALSLGALLAALFFALAVAWPERQRLSAHDLSGMRQYLDDLLKRKSRYLTWTLAAFWLGVLFLATTIFIVLL